MDLALTGKGAIVTGGSKGIGKAVPLELAKEGVDVAICARDRGAQVVAFLASTKAASITGVAIDASGGSLRAVFH